jgi:hypothetical protein
LILQQKKSHRFTDNYFVPLSLSIENHLYILLDIYNFLTFKICESVAKVQRKMCGQSLGKLNKQRDEGFWAKGLGAAWNQWNAYYKGYVNVMVNAEVATPIE